MVPSRCCFLEHFHAFAPLITRVAPLGEPEFSGSLPALCRKFHIVRTPCPALGNAMPSLRTRLFHVYARLRRPMTLGVRGLVENAEGHILLVRHTYIGGWHMPGGGVERGEPCIEALRREMAEEAGILLQGRPALSGIFSNHAAFPNDHVLLYHVPAPIWAQGKATAVAEIAETRWCPPSDLPDGTTAGTRLRLSEFYGDAAPTPYWSGRA